jgi:hypothetical protein
MKISCNYLLNLSAQSIITIGSIADFKDELSFSKTHAYCHGISPTDETDIYKGFGAFTADFFALIPL